MTSIDSVTSAGFEAHPADQKIPGGYAHYNGCSHRLSISTFNVTDNGPADLFTEKNITIDPPINNLGLPDQNSWRYDLTNILTFWENLVQEKKDRLTTLLKKTLFSGLVFYESVHVAKILRDETDCTREDSETFACIICHCAIPTSKPDNDLNIPLSQDTLDIIYAKTSLTETKNDRKPNMQDNLNYVCNTINHEKNTDMFDDVDSSKTMSLNHELFLNYLINRNIKYVSYRYVSY